MSQTIATHDGVRPSNKVKATASWRRSPAPRTRWPARWKCSAPRWRRSGCGSACIPAKSSCATKATTPARPSTAQRGCATWATAARPCSPVSPKHGARPAAQRRVAVRSGQPRLRDLPRPERVIQLCHPDVVNEFPPLRAAKAVASRRLPVQLTSFVGRDAELTQVRELLTENRLVTLTGAGGAGKTRLAIQIAGHSRASSATASGVWIWRRSPTPSWCRSQRPAHWGCPTSPAARRWTR